MNNFSYIGQELEIFRNAKNWKSYFGGFFQPYLRGDVLEVGAGVGAVAEALGSARAKRWTCLEPDSQFLAILREKARQGVFGASSEMRGGTIYDLKQGEYFDAILYVDVLEHIQEDKKELARAAEHLRQRGKILVLSPAHNFLFSPFDRAIGHVRRYSKRTLRAAAPKHLAERKLIYLDSAGFFLSFFNRIFLRSSLPGERQILFWDRRVIPLSRALDPVFQYHFGKSLLGIWEKLL